MRRHRASSVHEDPGDITSIDFVFTVRHAQGLKNLDGSLMNLIRSKKDKSDPYCKVTDAQRPSASPLRVPCIPHIFRQVFVGSDFLGQTEVVWDNLDPVWETKFVHTCKAIKGSLDHRSPEFRYGSGALATFLLFDKDFLSKDDHLGWVHATQFPRFHPIPRSPSHPIPSNLTPSNRIPLLAGAPQTG